MLHVRALKSTNHNVKKIIRAATDTAVQWGSSLSKNGVEAICMSFRGHIRCVAVPQQPQQHFKRDVVLNVFYYIILLIYQRYVF